jgi:hypothetical protein
MHTKIARALISVSDKRGLEGFARSLAQIGIEILSTGGTYRTLRQAGIPVREVSDYTGFPEMLHGRVKTLHPKVHGGILALRDDATHTAAMKEHGIAPIDLVVIDLYPFEATVAREGVERAEAIEQIDIGGPSMVRSAAKNHRFVAVVTDPADYGRVLDELARRDGAIGDELRRALAVKAFQTTARYDAAIAGWLHAEEVREGRALDPFPDVAVIAGSSRSTTWSTWTRRWRWPRSSSAPSSRSPSTTTPAARRRRARSRWRWRKPGPAIRCRPSARCSPSRARSTARARTSSSPAIASSRPSSHRRSRRARSRS